MNKLIESEAKKQAVTLASLRRERRQLQKELSKHLKMIAVSKNIAGIKLDILKAKETLEKGIESFNF